MLFDEAPMDGVGAGKGIVEDGNEKAEITGRDCPLDVDCSWLAPDNDIPVDWGTTIDSD